MNIYSIDFDKVQTIEDVKLVLKFLGSRVNREFTNTALIKEFGIEHLITVREQKYGC